MSQDDNKIPYEDDNLKFEEFVSQVSIPHNVFPRLELQDNLSSGFLSLSTVPITAQPIIPVDIAQLMEAEKDNLEYPSEDESEILYQYNKPTSKNTSTIPRVGDIMPQDIMRKYDLCLEVNSSFLRSSCSESEIDNIFTYIEENDSTIHDVLKEYRVPYPISKALINKIIQTSLNCKERK